MTILKNRKIRKLSIATALTLGAVLSVNAPAISQDKTPLKITMVAGVKGDPFYITMMCGAKKEATRLGATFDFQAPESFSPTDQIPIVNGVAAARPDIMLIAPTHDSAMIVPIEQVAQAGTKVVLVDTSLQDTSSTVAQISTDDYQGGIAAAEEMQKLTGGKGAVLLLNFQPGVSTTEARGRGFVEKAKELGLRVLDEQFSGTDIQKSTSIVSAVMQQAPDLAGIFTTTDFGAQGTVAALRAANRLGDIKVVGFDASPVMVEQLKADEIQAIVSQKANEIGVLGIEQGVKASKGEATADKPIKVSTITINKDTLNNAEVAQALQENECRD
ncbi:ABC transporter substrate-binding protein [Mesorhizobium sp. GR13]|uniref:ABC transporter substrate-binding protein n=1 Tax=Mesorhizobium sp. GR13 TaxID=2562308 RepID=UPI0010C09B4F|nr:ABC transporter substrate-binding protein [Mesorhizobium sp. GR13]